MNRAVGRQVDRIERALGIARAGDRDDDGADEAVSAEDRLAGHVALVELVRSRGTPEALAEADRLERGFVPGPGRRRRLSPAAEAWLDDLLATRAGPPTFELARADHGFPPEGERVAGAADRED